MNIFIGSSSSDRVKSEIKTSANDLIEMVAKIDDVTLVYGASFSGIMGEVAAIFEKNKKDKIGVTVDIYKDDIDISRYKKIYFEKSPIERTKKIYELSDIALFVPGGIGTLEELFSFIMEKDEEKDDKLIIIYNKDFFYTPLLEYMYKLRQENIIRRELSDYLFISSDIEEIIEKIKLKKKERK